MYESPITIIQGQLEATYEEDILKTVQSYSIDINKDELVKALAYDRKQYEKGFRDAEEKFVKHSTWILSVPDFIIRTSRNMMCPAETFKCGNCGHEILRSIGRPLPNYCENCGAKMKED